ncbi:GAP family protein [Aeromicrobium phragmitis]|uniref:GAP family protein n=1 Tax=Aeromicrobium phragmitis TaxID=2478914 RepID=A0A3L8PJH1_9ACTN|nr:GAP family protein [Aeromicrobium phragmitis]RLV54718.1 GAP family protein [Aeromicrobium phragmitis]
MAELDLTLAGVLAVLALIDSTSFGTLLIPIWFMLAPGRLRAGRILLFLLAVASCYLVVGVALYSGLGAVAEPLGRLVTTTPVLWAQLVIGVVLVIWSFPLEKRPSRQPGRLLRWRDAVVGDGGSVRSLLGVAVLAVGLEVATMVPYLAAIGIIASLEVSWLVGSGVLLGYCLVMVAPAGILLAARLAAAGPVEPLLRRIESWMQKNAQSTLAWTVGIVGFLLAINAADSLGLLG